MNKIVASLAFIFGCDSSIGRNGYYFLRRNLFTLWRNILTPMTFSSFVFITGMKCGGISLIKIR